MRNSPGSRATLLAIAAIAIFGVCASALPATTRLVAKALSRFAIELRWSHGGTGEISVEVERRSAGSPFQNVATLPAGSTTWQDDGLTPSTHYAYRVRSVDASGPLPWSNIASATTFKNHPPVVVTSLAGHDELPHNRPLRTTITAFDPDGDDVTVRLADPPTGFVFEAMEGVPSGTTHEARWRGTSYAGGLKWLHFKAFDSVEPGRVVERRERVMLSSFSGEKVASGDVDGDGKTDLVVVAAVADVGGVVDAGAVYCWSDVAHGTGAPTATLTVPGAAATDGLGSSGIVLTDVTGDGVDDVIVASSGMQVGGVGSVGTIHVFAGGSGFTGSLAPTATLTRPGGAAFDKLGSSMIRFADLDGDGIDDLVVPVPLADVPVRDAGQILVWRGGATLTGAPLPVATLGLAAPARFDELGDKLRCADVTGDRIPDVVATGRKSLWLWKGGAGLSGAPAPDAELADAAGNAVSLTDLADLDRDGKLDVLGSAGGRTAANGAANAGVLLIWSGGSGLSGTPAPTAEIFAANPQVNEFFPGTIQLADVTGDGELDVVGNTLGSDVNGVVDVGSVHVVASAGGFHGTIAATANFVPSSGSTKDTIGINNCFYVHDVTGDGIDDVVAGSSMLDLPGTVDAGGAYVWAGSRKLAGTVTESARLFSNHPLAGDQLTELGSNGPSVQFGDVTGDGLDDVVIFSSDTTVRSRANGVDSFTISSTHRTLRLSVAAGNVLVFHGGGALFGTPAPFAELFVSEPQDHDHLGSARGGAALFDWNGDGVQDVLAASPWMGSVKFQGSIQMWLGGRDLHGKSYPDATLEAAGAKQGDELGDGSGLQIQTADVDADGLMEIVAVAQHADVGATVDAGRAYVWRYDASRLLGNSDPDCVLGRPSPANLDDLGWVGQFGQSLLLIDADEDGKLDLFLGGEYVDVLAVADAGAFEFWSGATLNGTPTPLELAVPGAQPGDTLGADN